MQKGVELYGQHKKIILAGAAIVGGLAAYILLGSGGTGDYNGVHRGLENAAAELGSAGKSLDLIRGGIISSQESAAAISAGIIRGENALAGIERELDRGERISAKIAARIERAEGRIAEATKGIDTAAAGVGQSLRQLDEGKRIFTKYESGSAGR